MKTSRLLSLSLAALMAAASLSPAGAANVPFKLSVKPAKNQPAPALQSFAFAESGGKWLLVGGRTNGFHRTSTPESTFPSKYENRYFYVVDPVADLEWKVAVPAQYQEFLSATNMNFTQAGDLLVIAGGYGTNCENDDPSCYLTYPRLTALHVPNIIAAITSGQSGQIPQYIWSLEDERFRVTGGGLSYVNGEYFLVLGQDYDKIYKGAYTGKYTEQIRVFSLVLSGSSMSVVNYRAIGDPTGITGPDSQFHRRDLNVVESFRSPTQQGVTVYGGVFTKDGGGWTHPIQIDPVAGGGNPAVTLDTSFSQKMSQYECAHLLMFDPATGTMFTSLFGGISYYYYNAQGQLEESNLDNWLPFISAITTLARDANGTTEVIQPANQSLPGLLGANAVFTPAPGMPHMGTTEVIDYSRLPAGSSILVGWIYGGIRATAPQSSQFDPTFASETIYEVYLERNP